MTPPTINITIPRAWSELTPRQAHWLLRFLTRPVHHTDPRAIALLRFTGIRIIGSVLPAGPVAVASPQSGDVGTHPGASAEQQDILSAGLRLGPDYLISLPTLQRSRYLKRRKKELIIITPEEFAIMLRELDWILRPLIAPWRPDKIAGRKARPAFLNTIPFGYYLATDNHYARLLMQKQNVSGTHAAIDAMAELLLHPAPWWRRLLRLDRLTDADRHAILLWYTAVKEKNIRIYPDFYRPAGDDSTLAPDNARAITPAHLRAVMDAQIRALTKGDITKERRIMEMPMQRAMVELNALAKEYAQLHEKKK